MKPKRAAFSQRWIQVYRQLRYFVWPFIVLLAVLLPLRFLYSREEIYFYINRLHTNAGDVLFPYITHLGSTGAAVILVVLLAFFNRRQAFVLATAYCFTALVNFALKFLVAFPRPRRYFVERLHDIYFVPGVEVLDNFRSFPSGHSVCAFTAATVLAYYSKNRYLPILYLLLAILVAYSRMYMSQHFFEDVIAGATEGIALSMLWLAFIQGKGYAAGTTGQLS
ncbi:phosphatase PAP2 family protein [Chitinophaga nivalis]|uniref:Phosphatase PAP2 family protein n=1 Tax=Chitinophaga nivalis TaxID=2991709 RepID=A0ABT3IL10_9BACT|nr:phosphatase PAP2 family protein [Chitinophaga nivalis]MCW3465657.1 phosphatase PAP2 family protein [Chitinophaga nivalis]MCW3484652.1 phosphatase PAP2 family protein [Chitinophaga nivalis]